MSLSGEVLVLVDLQGDYLRAPGLEPSPAAIVAGAGALLDAARVRGIPVVHLHTEVHRAPDDRMAHWRERDRWWCEAGTPGCAPPARLAPLPGELRVTKTGFGPPRQGLWTRLLLGSGWARWTFAGVHAHACVREAVLSAYDAGRNVALALEATGSDDPAHAAITLRYLRERGIALLGAGEAIAAWNAPTAALPVDAAGLVGTFRLVRAERHRMADGSHELDADARGQLMYGADGRMSVLLVRGRGADPSGAASLVAYAGGWDVEGAEVRHRVEVSSRPSWVGQVLRRTARWEAGRLILVTPEHESSHDGVRGVVTLTWERAG